MCVYLRIREGRVVLVRALQVRSFTDILRKNKLRDEQKKSRKEYDPGPRLIFRCGRKIDTGAAVGRTFILPSFRQPEDVIELRHSIVVASKGGG